MHGKARRGRTTRDRPVSLRYGGAGERPRSGYLREAFEARRAAERPPYWGATRLVPSTVRIRTRWPTRNVWFGSTACT